MIATALLMNIHIKALCLLYFCDTDTELYADMYNHLKVIFESIGRLWTAVTQQSAAVTERVSKGFRKPPFKNVGFQVCTET